MTFLQRVLVIGLIVFVSAVAGLLIGQLKTPRLGAPAQGTRLLRLGPAA